MKQMTQVAPYPEALAELVAGCAYRPRWKVWLEEDTARDTHEGENVGHGMTLILVTRGYDTYHPDRGEHYGVHHYFIVPAATYDKRAWMRWLLDRFLDVEVHEACEFFQIDGERPFAPNHGPGRNPYSVLELGTDLDARTRFTGEVNA